MHIVLGVAAAGFFGAVTRYGIGFLLPDGNGHNMPWATLFINLSGSWLLGLLIGSASRLRLPAWAREAAGTGFLGAFTTFSAFNAQLASLVQHGEYGVAALYAALSGGAGWLLAAWGLSAGRGGAA